MLDCPRLSVCLSNSARYQIQRNGVLAEVHLRRGEVIYVPAGCVMEPHPQAQYVSLGIVFHPQLTRFLLAKKLPITDGKSHHQFLLAHHSPVALDQDGLNLCRALENSSKETPAAPYLRCLMEALLWKAKQLLWGTESPLLRGKGYFTWQAACQYVNEHLQDRLERKDIARFLNLHPNHISRLFATFGNGSFNEYLLQTRLRRASELLGNPSLNVSQIAHSCGFLDTNYFIRCYRKTFGTSPGKARVQ